MALSSSTKRVLKNATFIYGSLLFNQLSRAIYVIVLARYLGPDLYGLLSFGQAWYVVFLPIGLLGLGPVLISAVGRDRVEGILVAHRITAIRSLTLTFVAIISAFLGCYTADSGTVGVLLVIFSIALAGRACSMWADELFQAHELAHFSFRQDRLFRSAEVALGIIVALVTRDVILVALSHAFVWLAQGGRGLYLVHRHVQPMAFLWQWPEIRLLLVAGVPMGLSTALDAFLIQGGVILYRAGGAPDELVGNLGILLQVMVILATGFGALGRAALPAISRSVDRGDSHHRLYLSAMIRIGFLFGTLAGIWAIAIGQDLLLFVLGSKFEPAAAGLRLMMWSLIPYIIMQASISSLVAQRQYVWLMWVSIGGAATLTIAVTLLASFHGMSGVIWGVLIGFCVNAVLALVVLYRFGLLDHISDLPKQLAVLCASLLAVTELLDVHVWLAGLAATVVLLGGTLLLGIVRNNEKNFLLGLVGRRR